MLLNQIFLAAAAQGLLLCVVVLTIPTNRRANLLLAVYLGLESLHLLYLHIVYLETGQPPSALLRFMFGLRALSGPAVYLYVRALTDPSFRLRSRLLLHTWVLLFSLGWFGFLSTREDWLTYSAAELWGRPSTALLAIYQSLVMGGYAIAAHHRLQQHQLRLQRALSAVDHVNLGWLKRLMGLLVAVSLLHLALEALRLLHLVAPPVKGSLNLSVTMLLIYLIAIGGLRQPQVFSAGLRSALAAVENDDEDDGETASLAGGGETATAKYRKSGLDELRREQIWAQLCRLLDNEQVYLEAGLDLPTLARALEVRPQELSEVINTTHGGTFYQLINERRIEAARAMLRDPAFQGRKLLDIALSSGFNSQSTFYSHFRRLTGTTPSAYRQRFQSSE